MTKIYNEVIIDMNPESPTFEETIYEDSFEHDGDMMLAQTSLSQLLSGSAKKWAAKDIARKQEKERGKESSFAGLMALLKPVAGIASKGLMTALGLGTGGLAPLLLGLGTAGFSKLFSSLGRGAGLGADPSQITATGKYGYGKEGAKTIREGLTEGIEKRDPFSKESMLGDIVSSYVSALVPKIGVGKAGGVKVTGGDLAKQIKEKGFLKSLLPERLETGLFGTDVGGLEGVKLAFDPKKYDELVKAGTVRSAVEDEGWAFTDPLEGETSEFLTSKKHKSLLAEMEKLYGGEDKAELFKNIQLGPDITPAQIESMNIEAINKLPTAPPLSSSLNWRDAGISEYDEFGSWGAHVNKSPLEVAQEKSKQFYKDYEFLPGYDTPVPVKPNVPLALEEAFTTEPVGDIQDFGFSEFGDWGAYTSLPDIPASSPLLGGESPLYTGMKMSGYKSAMGFEGGGQVPSQTSTISDYFGRQGKTPDGSNKQSLAEMLGKK